MKFIDLSHSIENGMITYKGLPGPVITDHMSRSDSRKNYAEGTEFQIGKIEMVANTGTYLDSPFHRYAEGKDLSELPLSSLASINAMVIRVKGKGRSIDRSHFEGKNLRRKAVLVHTGWDQHWRTTQYSENHPFLTAEAAEYLAGCHVRLVGIDSFNIDDVAEGRRPAHSVLLQNEIPIVEHLCHLEELPDQGFVFFAVPPKVRSFGTFPVRAFAIIR